MIAGLLSSTAMMGYNVKRTVDTSERLSHSHSTLFALHTVCVNQQSTLLTIKSAFLSPIPPASCTTADEDIAPDWPGPKVWPVTMTLISFFALNVFLQGLRAEL